MQKTPLDPHVADTAPSESVLTVYDEEHVITYLRLLDADAKGADWREARGAERPHCVTHVSGMNCHLSQEGHLPPTFVDDWRPKLPLELPLVPDCARKYLYIEYVG